MARGLLITYKDGSTDKIVYTNGEKYDINFEDGEVLVGASFDTANLTGSGSSGGLGKAGFTIAKKN